MEIKNETRLTQEEFTSMMRRNSKILNTKVLLPIVVVLSVITLVLIILNTFEVKGFTFTYVIISACVLGAFLGLYIIVRNPMKLNSNFEGGVVYRYTFFDFSFSVEVELKGQKSITTIEYNSLYNVVDRGDFMALYISKAQVYLLKYDGFAPEDNETAKAKLLEFKRKK